MDNVLTILKLNEIDGNVFSGDQIMAVVESRLNSADAFYRKVLGAGEYWVHEIKAGEVLRIVDLEGNQSADTMFYNAQETSERYSAEKTITAQRNINVAAGTVLRSNLGNPMLTLIADTCGRHDTLGGPARRRAIRSATPSKNDTCTHAGVVFCQPLPIQAGG